MRKLKVFVALIVVLALSVAAGLIAADWPRWCKQAGWCDSSFPQ